MVQGPYNKNIVYLGKNVLYLFKYVQSHISDELLCTLYLMIMKMEDKMIVSDNFPEL